MTNSPRRAQVTDAPSGRLSTARHSADLPVANRLREFTGTILENIFQCQLELPLARFARNLAEGAAPGICIGCAPIRMIQEIENLKAELQPLGFGYRKILSDANIPAPKSRITQRITPLDSKGPGRRLSKSVLVEPYRRSRK